MSFSPVLPASHSTPISSRCVPKESDPSPLLHSHSRTTPSIEDLPNKIGGGGENDVSQQQHPQKRKPSIEEKQQLQLEMYQQRTQPPIINTTMMHTSSSPHHQQQHTHQSHQDSMEYQLTSPTGTIYQVDGADLPVSSPSANSSTVSTASVSHASVVQSGLIARVAAIDQQLQQQLLQQQSSHHGSPQFNRHHSMQPSHRSNQHSAEQNQHQQRPYLSISRSPSYTLQTHPNDTMNPIDDGSPMSTHRGIFRTDSGFHAAMHPFHDNGAPHLPPQLQLLTAATPTPTSSTGYRLSGGAGAGSSAFASSPSHTNGAMIMTSPRREENGHRELHMNGDGVRTGTSSSANSISPHTPRRLDEQAHFSQYQQHQQQQQQNNYAHLINIEATPPIPSRLNFSSEVKAQYQQQMVQYQQYQQYQQQQYQQQYQLTQQHQHYQQQQGHHATAGIGSVHAIPSSTADQLPMLHQHMNSYQPLPQQPHLDSHLIDSQSDRHASNGISAVPPPSSSEVSPPSAAIVADTSAVMSPATSIPLRGILPQGESASSQHTSSVAPTMPTTPVLATRNTIQQQHPTPVSMMIHPNTQLQQQQQQSQSHLLNRHSMSNSVPIEVDPLSIVGGPHHSPSTVLTSTHQQQHPHQLQHHTSSALHVHHALHALQSPHTPFQNGLSTPSFAATPTISPLQTTRVLPGSGGSNANVGGGGTGTPPIIPVAGSIIPPRIIPNQRPPAYDQARQKRQAAQKGVASSDGFHTTAANGIATTGGLHHSNIQQSSSTPITGPSRATTQRVFKSPRDLEEEEAQNASLSKCLCLRRRFSFSVVLSLLIGTLILSAVSVTWYISYETGAEVASDLSTEIREVLFEAVSYRVTQQFERGLTSLHALSYVLPIRYPNFSNMTSAVNTTGFLSELLLMGALNPTITVAGFINKQSTLVLIRKTHPSATSGFSAQEGIQILMAEKDYPYNKNSTYLSLRSYFPTPIRAPPDTRGLPGVLSYTLDLEASDSPDNIARYLGAVNSTKPITELSYYQTSSNGLRRLGILNTWTDVIKHQSINAAGVYEASSTVRVITRLEPLSVSLNDSATLGLAPMAFIDIDLLSFQVIFDELDVGQHGVAYLFTQSGVVAASSDTSFVSWDLDFAIEGTLANRVKQLMYECQLISSQPIDVFNATSILKTDHPHEGCVHLFSWAGNEYRFQAALMDQTRTGLPWSYAVVTRDNDFYGTKFTSASITVVWSTCIVMFCASLLAIVAARLLTQPIVLIVDSMEKFIEHLSITDSEERKQALRRLRSDWHTVMDEKDVTEDDVHTTNTDAGGVKQQRPISELRAAEIRTQRERKVRWTTREVYFMQRAYSSMLATMSSFDELKAVNDAKKRFIRYIFHEVRVPFNAIVLGIEQLQSDLSILASSSPHLVPDAMDTVKILSEQSDVVTHILNDVLSLQKIEDGALNLEYRAFDMERMIRTTLYSFKAPCMEKNLKLRIQLTNLNQVALRTLQVMMKKRRETKEIVSTTGTGTGSGRFNADTTTLSHAKDLASKDLKFLRFGVWGDMHRLRQVLSNFVSNSIKFTPKGKEIRVCMSFDEFVFHSRFLTAMENYEGTASTVPDVGSHSVGRVVAHVIVSDQGKGIPKEHLDNLFTPYTQINAGTMQKGKGTGLGLSLSKNIIELHNGSVALERTVEGEGSDFSFTVPMGVHLLPPSSDGSSSDEPTGTNNTRDTNTLSVDSPGPQVRRKSEGNIHERRPSKGTIAARIRANAMRRPTQPLIQYASPSLASTPIPPLQSPTTVTALELMNEVMFGTPAMRPQLDTTQLAQLTLTQSLTKEFALPPLPDLSPEASPTAASAAVGAAVNGVVISQQSLPPLPVTQQVHQQLVQTTPIQQPQTQPQQQLDPSAAAAPVPFVLPAAPGLLSPVDRIFESSPDPPLPLAPLAARLSVSTGSELAVSTEAELRPLRVLIVEDSAPNRKLLCALLKRLKCVVSQAEDGRECCDLFQPIFSLFPVQSTAAIQQQQLQQQQQQQLQLQQQGQIPREASQTRFSPIDSLCPFDIILMDNTMPVMDGCTATKTLRSHGLTIPIIGVTGNALDVDIQEFCNSGANEVLTKPVSASKLSGVLKKYDRRHMMARKNSTSHNVSQRTTPTASTKGTTVTKPVGG